MMENKDAEIEETVLRCLSQWTLLSACKQASNTIRLRRTLPERRNTILKDKNLHCAALSDGRYCWGSQTQNLMHATPKTHPK